MKKPMQSKTIWFSIIIMFLGVFQGFITQVPIDPKEQSLILIVIGLSTIYLRFKTNSPLI